MVEAGVAQLVELQPSKLDVAGSNPVARSIRRLRGRGTRRNNASRSGIRFPRSERGFQGMRRGTPWLEDDAHVAQSVERVLGKDEVTSSILVVGSRR